MAFKSVTAYNEERFGGLFLLRNDGDYADVVFLYRDVNDVLVADTHYIKSADYSGYVHCCGRGCPACGKNIRVQPKIFIPMYNITAGEIQFWDRNIRFENQLNTEVFENYPNPCDFVFRITREGAAGDINTKYHIQAVGKNPTSYSDILRKFNIQMPDHYDTVVRDMSITDLNRALNSSSNTSVSSDEIPDYQVVPRSVVGTTADYKEPQVSTVSEATEIDIMMTDDVEPDSADTDDVIF